MKDTNWKEAKKEEAKYGVILRPESYDTSVCFYASLEDLEWAMKNSWFDPKEAIPVKILTTEIKIKEELLN